jgi:membrane protein
MAMIASSRMFDLAHRVVQRFFQDRCTQIASSLTFTTLLALVPIITVAVTLISAFPVFVDISAALRKFVLENLVPQSADVIVRYAEQFSANTTKLTAVGLALLAVTAIMLLFTIERAFDHLWRARRRRPIMQRVIVYWTLLTIGPVLIGASLTVTSWLVARSLEWVGMAPGAGLALLAFVPVVLTSVALALLYLILPSRRVAGRDALIGGVIAGIAFELMKRGFAAYLSRFPSYELVYGAFATLPVFLIWIYLSWLVVLLGAIVVAVLPEWRERAGESESVPGSDFFDALQILRFLWQAHREGKVVRLADLFGATKARIDRIEAILDAMVGAGWITRAAPRGWVLCRDASGIKLEDVYRLFVFRGDAHVPGRDADPDVERIVHEVSARIAHDLQLSVGALFVSAEQAAASALRQEPHLATNRRLT